MPLKIKRIKELREKLKLTQEAAAKAAGLHSKQAWNNIESGRQTNLTLDTLEKVAKALHVKAKELLA